MMPIVNFDSPAFIASGMASSKAVISEEAGLAFLQALPVAPPAPLVPAVVPLPPEPPLLVPPVVPVPPMGLPLPPVPAVLPGVPVLSLLQAATAPAASRQN